MKKSKAIKVLKLQKEKLIKDTYFTEQNWINQTSDYVKKYFKIKDNWMKQLMI